ncbi:MAG: hypothetical protein LAN59_13140 [Acidobacteriia bacterium]|nr:hypothetical protein [Terriglobia bacterium]
MTMRPEILYLVEVLERQLSLIRELASDLIACRASYVAMDLDGIYQHVAVQDALCEKLRQAAAQRSIAWQSAAAAMGLSSAGDAPGTWIASLDPELAARLRRVLTELALTEGQVRHLNQVHLTVVEGSRRTLSVLANALAAFAPIYAPPAATPLVRW